MCDSWISGSKTDPQEKWVENYRKAPYWEVIPTYWVRIQPPHPMCVKFSLSVTVSHSFSHSVSLHTHTLHTPVWINRTPEPGWLTGWCRMWGKTNEAQKWWVKKPSRQARARQAILRTPRVSTVNTFPKDAHLTKWKQFQWGWKWDEAGIHSNMRKIYMVAQWCCHPQRGIQKGCWVFGHNPGLCAFHSLAWHASVRWDAPPTG